MQRRDAIERTALNARNSRATVRMPAPVQYPLWIRRGLPEDGGYGRRSIKYMTAGIV